MTATISLRPIVEDDEPFLFKVYSSTREEELKQLPWDEARKEAFLRQQYNAQHTHYFQHFSDAAYQVVLADGVPVGRLYLDRREDEFRIIDIAILTEFRGRGIGSSLLRDVLREAGRASKPVRIYVEQDNPAMRLYKRLGFRKIGEAGFRDLMQWEAEPTAAEPGASSPTRSPEEDTTVD